MPYGRPGSDPAAPAGRQGGAKPRDGEHRTRRAGRGHAGRGEAHQHGLTLDARLAVGDLTPITALGQTLATNDPEPAERNHGTDHHEDAANHRPWGVFAACGRHIPAGGAVPDLEMVDLAPVLLRLAGVPIPAGLDGKLPPWLPSAAPEPGLASAEQAAPPPPTASPYSPEEESAVQRRLADLGYM